MPSTAVSSPSSALSLPCTPDEGLTRDPDDDCLVALAQSASADYLVSGDQDLLALLNPQPLILTPHAFLDLLMATAPAT